MFNNSYSLFKFQGNTFCNEALWNLSLKEKNKRYEVNILELNADSQFCANLMHWFRVEIIIFLWKALLKVNWCVFFVGPVHL